MAALGSIFRGLGSDARTKIGHLQHKELQNIMRQVYLIAAFVGFVLTYALLVPFLIENGFNLPLFFAQLNANRIAIMAGVDILISSIVFWIWMFGEGRRLGIQHLWVFVVLNLVVGLSLALPLFLYFREGKRQTVEASA